MIEPARADVVRPAVATDDPHAAADQVVEDAAQVLDDRTVELVEPARERRDPLTLGTQLGLPHLRRGQDLVHQLCPYDVAQLLQSEAGELVVAVGREAQPQPELGVVLEQRVRPCRAVPGRIDRPRRRRLVSAVDRRAAGCVGDGQSVAEQLREQLQVRRLAAPGAGAGELEQRFEELGPADGAEVHAGAVVCRQLLEEGDVLALAREQRLQVVEVDRLAARLIGRGHRTGLDAQPASGAVLDVHLQREPGVREAGPLQQRRPEAVGSALQALRGVVAGADHAVRADEAAVAALDAELRIPDGDDVRDVALLVLGRATRIRAVDRKRAHGQLIAEAGHHRRGHSAHELRSVGGHELARLAPRRDSVGDLNLVKGGERAVDRLDVALHDRRRRACRRSSGSRP